MKAQLLVRNEHGKAGEIYDGPEAEDLIAGGFAREYKEPEPAPEVARSPSIKAASGEEVYRPQAEVPREKMLEQSDELLKAQGHDSGVAARGRGRPRSQASEEAKE